MDGRKIPGSLCWLLLTATLPAVAQTGAEGVTISGPLPGEEQPGGMFNPSAIELEERGYIEQEYFIEGRASRYTTPDGETGEVLDSGHPFRTRFIVRRPRSAARFNGTLVAEWNNVTAGRDLDIDWWQSGDHFVRNGYAYISVSAQRVGVNHLRENNPERYGSLDVSDDGALSGDELSYDIFAAVARAAMQGGDGETDVLGGLRPEMVIATGHSQSASRLGVYVNSVHGIDPVFDGFMIHGGGARLRDDQPVRIFRVMAETDMARRAADPQPDSAGYRHWEVAGSSHVDVPFEIEYARMLAVEAGEEVPGNVTPREQNCNRPPYSRVPFRHAMNAAFEHLRGWIADGTPPPRAPRLHLEQATAPLSFDRDEYGNVRGGIRLAEHAVPVATNTGMNTGDGFCRLYGSHEPFSRETLRELYPDHQSYVSAVRETVNANIESGYVLEHDGMQTIREAERSDIGRW